MPAARFALALLIAASLAAPADAQFFIRRKAKEIGPPKTATPYEAEVWPFPPPDPKSWWDDKRPKIEEAADPFGGRRIRRGERLPDIPNGVDASTYRLWGLMPLQWQLLRGDETIIEVWTRPTATVRQTVTRVLVRGDGRTFLQARAGLACCEAGIGRRLGFDVELPAGSDLKFLGLARHWVWDSPRDVRVVENGASEALCVEGSSYELTRLTAKGARTVRRACDPAEVGEAAEVLEAVLAAALGHDPRYDVIFSRGADFQNARQIYRGLIESGGKLKPVTQPRQGPPGAELAPAPEVEAEPGSEPTPSAPAPPRP